MSELAALEILLEDRRLRVEERLKQVLRPGRSAGVAAAVEYSLLAPAKRFRPLLALLVSEVFHGNPESVLPGACAVEMVHTASLILDDLPSMDNATSRRGRPACHVVHGEAVAILAAFALLNRAFEILAEGWPGADASQRSEIARELAQAVGLSGMIAGQASDLAMTDKPLDLETLEFIHSHKTGALFTAAAAIGALLSGAPPAERAAVGLYAKNLGLAFQIADDLLDVVGRAQEVGKDVGQDLKKTTFVSFAGIDGAYELAQELIDASQKALDGFGARAHPLRRLARYVLTRRR